MSYETVCTADGRMFVCVGRRVNGFDVENCQRILSVRPFPHASHSDFSPDNKKLAVKYTNGRIVILDLATGDVMRDYTNQKEGEGSEAFFSPDGQELVDGSWNGLISIRKLSGPGVSTKQFPGEMIDRISHDSHKRSWLIQHRKKSSAWTAMARLRLSGFAPVASFRAEAEGVFVRLLPSIGDDLTRWVAYLLNLQAERCRELVDAGRKSFRQQNHRN
jgi:dipeptidyl aminopeptidase/acylaminoacyl peptidase